MYRDMEMHHWRGEKRCWKALELDLSSEQRKGLETLNQTFSEESYLLRTELFSKRLEFREWLTNPAIKTEILRVKQTEIVELQSKLEAMTLDHLHRIRNLLTSEQLRRWCPEREFPHAGRMMHGPIRGPSPPPPSQ